VISPIIADLIAHVLDVRLAQLAKQHKLTYSRYADDITFSTSHREFPPAVAAHVSAGSPQWAPGTDLANVIQKAGFTINPQKTRMQFRMSRQLVTGLTVNDKVNIRPEYYRRARSMCHRLFKTGSYHRPTTAPHADAGELKLINSLGPIGGILSHIHHVKNTIDDREEPEKRKEATAVRKLYVRFLKYRYFVRLERPLIVCEGKTDNIYLKYAIRSLAAFQPKLGAFDGKIFRSAVAFFNYGREARRVNHRGEASRVLDLGGGTGALHYFFIKARYESDIRGFKHRPLKHPVIVLIDNDDVAKNLMKTLSQNFGISVDLQSPEPFFHVTDNLYLVKTPQKGATGASCIEDFFEPALLATLIDGKKFNLKKGHVADGEYGKFLFADKVVRPNASTINFAGFAPLLERITAVIDHYIPPAAA
jgi:RNA-directed DNA polymerase